MRSPTRIGLTIALILFGCGAGYLVCRDYERRHDPYFRLGAWYKTHHPKLTKMVIDELNIQGSERVFGFDDIVVRENSKDAEEKWIDDLAFQYFTSERAEANQLADRFVDGYQSTASQ